MGDGGGAHRDTPGCRRDQGPPRRSVQRPRSGPRDRFLRAGGRTARVRGATIGPRLPGVRSPRLAAAPPSSPAASRFPLSRPPAPFSPSSSARPSPQQLGSCAPTAPLPRVLKLLGPPSTSGRPERGVGWQRGPWPLAHAALQLLGLQGRGATCALRRAPCAPGLVWRRLHLHALRLCSLEVDAMPASAVPTRRPRAELSLRRPVAQRARVTGALLGSRCSRELPRAPAASSLNGTADSEPRPVPAALFKPHSHEGAVSTKHDYHPTSQPRKRRLVTHGRGRHQHADLVLSDAKAGGIFP